jgi:hypothetical protein
MPSPANTTNNTYCLSTNLTGQADAETYCNTLGGHLASWNSQAEQTEVEGYWIKAGLLLPLFHKAYWIGAVIGDEDMWPNFRWLDSLPGPNASGVYQHWGYYMPQNIIEPNNMFGQENCGAANASQTYSDAWGWMDINCNIRMPFMCRLNSGRPSCSPSILRPPSSCLCRLSHAAWLTAQHGPRPPGRARCGH